MSTTFDRRQLLTGAVLGGATLVAATALGSVGPEAAYARETVDLGADVPDPNFAEGRVSGITGSLLTVSGSDRVIHRVRATQATSIWKLRPASLQAVKIGDGLYARGVPMPDGTLAADAVWVNIVNLHAEITSMRSSELHLDHAGSHVVGHVVAGITSTVNDNGFATADLSALRVGSHISFIGAWRPDTNAVDIATIYSRN